MKAFFTQWHDFTYLIVKYTWKENAKELEDVHHYGSNENGHTEEQFVNPFIDGFFPEDSEFELFSNYSPCTWRNKKQCCRDIMYDTFKAEKTKPMF